MCIGYDVKGLSGVYLYAMGECLLTNDLIESTAIAICVVSGMVSFSVVPLGMHVYIAVFVFPDGHHKLIRWKMVTHAGINGFSRMYTCSVRTTTDPLQYMQLY